MSRCLFYRIDADTPVSCRPDLPPGIRMEIWRPRRDGLPPPALPTKPFAFWWLFDRLGFFANPHAGVLMLFDGDRIAHRSLVTPRWFRFPDMAPDDLQIGDVFTDPDYRGLGLARTAIGLINAEWAGQFRHMWYLCSPENVASIKVIEACGYQLVASGDRTRRFGLSFLGSYRAAKPEHLSR